MARLAALVSAFAALAVLVPLTGCAGDSPPSAHPGTEVIQGSTRRVDGSQMAIVGSGVFADAGRVRMPIGSPRTFTFTFDRGNLVVLNATGPAAGPLRLNTSTCAFAQTSVGTFRVLPGRSTGLYAGAAGHGTYAFYLSGVVPKTPAGRCDTGREARPPEALFAIQVSGPFLLNARN
jgi:hypothetical protein